jgi:hypothetical protein
LIGGRASLFDAAANGNAACGRCGASVAGRLEAGLLARGSATGSSGGSGPSQREAALPEALDHAQWRCRKELDLRHFAAPLAARPLQVLRHHPAAGELLLASLPTALHPEPQPAAQLGEPADDPADRLRQARLRRQSGSGGEEPEQDHECADEVQALCHHTGEEDAHRTAGVDLLSTPGERADEELEENRQHRHHQRDPDSAPEHSHPRTGTQALPGPQQQQDRHQEGGQPQQAVGERCHLGTERTDQVAHRNDVAGAMQHARIARIEGQKAGQEQQRRGEEEQTEQLAPLARRQAHRGLGRFGSSDAHHRHLRTAGALAVRDASKTPETMKRVPSPPWGREDLRAASPQLRAADTAKKSSINQGF